VNNSGQYRILHIAPTPFFADRGCHIRIRNEIEALVGHPVAVTLCTYHLGRDIDGIDIRRIWPIPGYRKLDAGYSPFKFPADILLFFLVFKTCFFEKPVLLHGHLHEGALIGWAVKTLLFWRSLPLIMDMQGSLSGELSSYGTVKSGGLVAGLAGKIEAVICRLVNFFLCSSSESKKTLIHDFAVVPEKIALLQDVVPDIFFKTHNDQNRNRLRRKLRIPEEKKVVLYTGSLLPGKGVQYVFESIKALSLQHDDLFFVLVGYPQEEAEAFVQTNGLGKKVLLPGQVDYGLLNEWLAVGDVAREPKENDSGEASGKLLHYMAAGLPVVCFDTENNRKMLGANGYYAENISLDSYIHAVNIVLDDPAAERRGQLGRDQVRATYSMAAVGERLFTVYSKMLTPGTPKE